VNTTSSFWLNGQARQYSFVPVAIPAFGRTSDLFVDEPAVYAYLRALPFGRYQILYVGETQHLRHRICEHITDGRDQDARHLGATHLLVMPGVGRRDDRLAIERDLLCVRCPPLNEQPAPRGSYVQALQRLYSA
jgi:predicted GIY-YIG superfamily endonuclease